MKYQKEDVRRALGLLAPDAYLTARAIRVAALMRTDPDAAEALDNRQIGTSTEMQLDAFTAYLNGDRVWVVEATSALARRTSSILQGWAAKFPSSTGVGCIWVRSKGTRVAVSANRVFVDHFGGGA